jgi:hypothetical protein
MQLFVRTLLKMITKEIILRVKGNIVESWLDSKLSTETFEKILFKGILKFC